jgi:hypothetical protein
MRFEMKSALGGVVMVLVIAIGVMGGMYAYDKWGSSLPK